MNQINFIHIRDHDDQRELLNYGGATIAYYVQRVADCLLVKYSVAECAPEDRFVKKIGRTISKTRLEANNLCGEFSIGNDQEDEIERHIVEEYLNYKSLYWEETSDIHDYWFPHHPGYKMDAPEVVKEDE